MISVVVPMYNYRNYIGENIESILKQTTDDWELIIVDDASRDKGHRVVRNYAKKDDRIHLIRLEENVGYGAAKNVGIRASKGEWIVVLDADDVLLANSLEKRVKYLKKHNKLWLHAKAYEMWGKKPPYKTRFKRRKATKRLEEINRTKNYSEVWTCMHAQTIMVHRGVYEKVGLYEPKLRSMGDKEMWARILHNVGKPLYLDDFVVYYRLHSGQMHRSAHKKKNLKRYHKLLKRYVNERRNGDLSKVEKL